MFGQDERTDELQVASRERLLTEIGVLQFALKSNQLEPTKQELQATKQELQATKQELQATKQELQATKQELLAACDAVYGSSAELGELRVQLNVAKDKVRRAQNRNKLIVNSATWKLGYLLMAPRRILLRVFNIHGT
ncbi:MAG: hypothetical protein D4R44_05000 [Actinobacteria bacterium]|nr:MAG: hypothetical protein D4R44_05000 [Actinomycetota bacterium]